MPCVYLATYDDDDNDEAFMEHVMGQDTVLSTMHELIYLILTTTQDRYSLYPFPDEGTEAQTGHTASK